MVYSSGVHLSATHIPGDEFLMADFLSRGIFLPSEWKLETSLFQRICQVLSFPPEFDLFASLLNFQLPKYCARYRDPHAWKIDDISMVRSASVCIPSVLPSSQSVREGRSGGGRVSFDCSLLASETLVSKVPVFRGFYRVGRVFWADLPPIRFTPD